MQTNTDTNKSRGKEGANGKTFRIPVSTGILSHYNRYAIPSGSSFGTSTKPPKKRMERVSFWVGCRSLIQDLQQILECR